MSVIVYVPRDSAALALGAEAVTNAILAEGARRGADLRIVRNGSRGLFWLEPLVEVATAAGRHAYGPVAAADVAGLFDAGFLEGRAHALHLGITDKIPELASQQRLTFRRVGLTDPTSIDDYIAQDGVVWHDEDRLEIHPHDAEVRGIAQDDWVGIASRAGETVLRAEVTERVQPGVVYTTFHFPESGANVVTTDNSDWATNCPEYKVTAVQAVKVNQPSQWQQRHRELTQQTRIHGRSKRSHA